MATTTLLQFLWPVFFIAALTYVVILIVQSYRSFRRRAKFIQQLPGAPPHWLFGNLNEVSRSLFR
jgi:Flp pilus assembly protein TadB